MQIGPNIFIDLQTKKDPYGNKSVAQMNSYSIRNQTQFPIKVQFDITQSVGARFTNESFQMHQSFSNKLKFKVAAESEARDICGVELWSTSEAKWNLKLDVTYKIKKADQVQRKLPNFSNKVEHDDDYEEIQSSVNEILHSPEYIACRKLNIDTDLMSTSQIETLLKENNLEKFFDTKFPPSFESIYGPDHNSEDNLKTEVVWLRPHEIFHGDFKVFDDIQPGDIKQGKLANCWFMCALSCMAEFQETIKRLFVTQTVQSTGIYQLNICKQGIWQKIIIDDYIPCEANSRTPIFSRANGNEIWVLLLEKAYAKIHGSYYALIGGETSEALIDLSACPTKSFDLVDDMGIQKQIGNGELFSKLMKYDQENYLMSASTSSDGNQCHESLVKQHAYAIIQVKKYKNHQLLNIRNPWGEKEWDGDWSDMSELWTEEAMQKVKPDLDKNDGTFWMNFQDFCANFITLDVCMLNNFHENRFKCSFSVQQDEFDANIKDAYCDQYYEFTVTQKQRIHVSIHQQDYRIPYTEENFPYMSICMVLLEILPNGNHHVVDVDEFDCQRDLQATFEIQKLGTYKVVPLTSGCSFIPPAQLLYKKVDDSAILDMDCKLTDKAKAILRQIFTFLDSQTIDGRLSQHEILQFISKFQGNLKASFLKRLDKKIQAAEEYSLDQFIRFVQNDIINAQIGDKGFDPMIIFEAWGFDVNRGLWPTQQRLGMLMIQSQEAIEVKIHNKGLKDIQRTIQLALFTDFPADLQQKINETQGNKVSTLRHLEVTAEYTVLMRYFPLSHTFIYGIQNNLQDKALSITMDWHPEISDGQLHSPQLTPGTKQVTKLIQPTQLQQMFYSEASPEATGMHRKVRVTNCETINE